ncbi:MAG: nucleotidyltransferase [Pseudomonadota bacterium]
MKYDPIYDQWLDQLLADVAEKIQLTPNAYERAVDRYNRIAAFLNDALSGLADFRPIIYPQGSFRVGTTISACEDNEDYDIDLVLEIAISAGSNPEQVLQLIGDVMERGKGLLQFSSCRKKKRCVTIEYADMHLDITPAVLLDGTNPRVIGIFDRHPDRPDHAVANPEGFAQWFDQRVLPAELLQKRAMRAHTYPVPDQKPLEEKPIRLLSIQLLKRFRDLACDRRSYKRCPSVLLSRLSAEASNGAGLYDDLRRAAQHLARTVTLIPPPVSNPRCDEDILSDRWPEAVSDRDLFAHDLQYLDDRLSQLSQQGSQVDKLRILEELFGERPARRAFETAAKRLAEKSASGDLKLGVGRGAMGVAPALAPANAISVPKHKFYGEH